MNCSSCQHVNRPGRRFCVECGTALEQVCPSCQAPCEEGEKFCGDCGQPLAGARPRATGAARGAAAGDDRESSRAEAAPVGESGARKVVTIVFADLVGSTALHERIDAESAHRLMDAYYEVLRRAVEESGGTVVKLLGDGVMAAFGLRQVAEDDALRAVCAASQMQQGFAALAEDRWEALAESGLRVAVNTGEVVVSSGHDDLIGDPVNVAARLQEQGRSGDVVLGEATRRLVASRVTLAPLGSVTLKGRSEAVAAYRLVSLEPPAAAAVAPFVGRQDELRRLDVAYEVARGTPTARLAVLLGSPGLGKSRLLDEFMRRLAEEATILSAHCDAAGGDTFAPVAAALRSLLGLGETEQGETMQAAIEAALVTEEEADRSRVTRGIVALLGGSPAPPEESFFVIRRFLVTLARTRPVVLVIDDLQWAEPLLLDLLEHLVQWGGDAPLFVLVGARPELRELRSTLVVPGRVVGDVVTLGGLDAAAAMRLAANVIGAVDLPAAVAGKVLATSEGNPLFVSELVRMMVQEGALARDGDRWTVGAGLAALEMPPTIHALLAARIERLRPDERTVLERAAVVGRVFSRAAVAALLPAEGDDLDSRLEALIRSELLERDAGWFLGEPALRFHHLLIRDAAYRRLLKGTRADLHGRLADWIEARVGEAAEHDETVGRHLEQAHLLLRELGPLDDRARALGERAAARLSAAGRRALARDDLDLAAGLLGRAVDVLGREDATRAQLALDWCEALLSSGDVTPAAGAIEELARFAGDSRRLDAWRVCFAGQLAVLTAPDSLQAVADQVASAGEVLGELHDDAGEAKAHSVHAAALARLGKVGACEAALDRALAAARRAGDRRRANAVLAGAPVAALWGPSPVTRASGRCLDVVRVLRITQGAPAVEAVALACQGVLEALRGRTDAARRMLGSSRKIVEDLGVAQRIFEVEVLAARIDLLEGNAPEAERLLRRAYDGLRDLGLGIDAARAAALLGRALLDQDKAGEAEAISREIEGLAGDDLQAAIAWRGVRAQALAARGQRMEAIELARAAVGIAAATDALLDHAEARMALAVALRAAGHADEAELEERRSLDLWESKGATLLASKARAEGPSSLATDSSSRRSGRPPEATRPVRKPNLATAAMALLDRAIEANDKELLQSVFGDSLRAVEDLNGVEFGLQEVLESYRRLMAMQEPKMRHVPVAELGQRLAIARRRISAGGASGGRHDFGAMDREEITLLEADQSGCLVYGADFRADNLAAAAVHLYQRHALDCPEGPEHDRAEATARSLEALFAAEVDLGVVAKACAPDIEAVDHRLLGLPPLRGVETVVGAVQASLDLETASLRIRDLLAVEPGALLADLHLTGTARGGGDFELRTLLLVALGEDGRMERWESFEPGQETQALGRFERLCGRAVAASAAASDRPTSMRRLRPNRATALLSRINAAFAAGEFDFFEMPPEVDYEEVDHTTGVTFGREGSNESVRRLSKMPSAVLRYECLATLGEHLALTRRTTGAAATEGTHFDVGAFEHEGLCICEVGEEDVLRRNEVFGAGRYSEAIPRLYERYAELLPDGPEKVRAQATARTVAFWLRETGAATLLDHDVLTEDFEMVDHRLLGTWSARGRDEAARHLQSLLDLAEHIEFRHTDVLALRPEGILVRRDHHGVRREEGGLYERRFLALLVMRDDGRMARMEMFDADREAEALARFVEVLGPDDREVLVESPLSRQDEEAAAGEAGENGLEHTLTSLQPRFENAASRSARRFEEAWNARDWEAIEAMIPAGFLLEDRRSYAHLELDREQHLASLRERFDMPTSRYSSTLLATRGDHLSLVRAVFDLAGGDVGDSQTESLILFSLDEAGEFTKLVTFDAQDVVQAHLELDALYGEENGTGLVIVLSRAFLARDWDAIRAHLSPSLVQEDRRSLSLLGTTRGPEGMVANFRTMADLAPDTVPVLHHVRGHGRAHLCVASWQGTQLGGAFEIPLVLVFERDDQGRVDRSFVYDRDQIDEAWGHFQGGARALAGPDPFANAVTALFDRFARAWAARDWESAVATLSGNYRLLDRRSYSHLDLDRDRHLAALRMRFDMEVSGFRVEILATRGERLALARHVWELADGDVGTSESETLMIAKVDDCGAATLGMAFEPDQLETAYAELDALYEVEQRAAERAGPQAVRWARAAAARDWQTMRSLLAPDLRVRDRRALSLHGDLQGPEALLQLPIRLVELAPDSRPRLDHVRGSERCGLFTLLWEGSRDGGDYELPFVVVYELGEEGTLQGVDLFDQEQLGQATDLFDELLAKEKVREPFLNHAARTSRSILQAYVAGDWERFEAGFAPEFRYVDRRPFAHLDLDRSEYLAFTRGMDVAGRRSGTWEMLATRGERLVLQKVHFHFEGGAADDEPGRSELDFLTVVELGADGLLTRFVRFDSRDYQSAIAELDERFQAGEAAEQGIDMSCLIMDSDAARRGDWEEFSRGLRPDLRVEDHRILRFGDTLTGAEAFVETQKALFELAPDCRYRFDHVRCRGRAVLGYAVQMGTREGGAFESHFLSVTALAGDGRWEAVAAYDLEQFDQAWARFQEWGDLPSVSSSFENLATRNVDQSLRAYMETDPRRSDGSGARDAFGPYYAKEFRYQDRRGIAHLDLTRDEWFSFMDEMRTAGRRSGTWRHVATRGERLSIFRLRVRYSGGDGSAAVGESELEFLTVVEVDAAGTATAHVRFEVGDEEAAYAELDARFLAGEGAELGIGPRRLGMNQDAARRGDWGAFARGFRDDVHLADHRILGFGDTLAGVAGFIESQKALYELAPDSRYRLDHIRFRGRAGLACSVQMGTREGGAYESHFLAVTRVDAEDRWQSLDIYDVDRFDVAMARFLEIADGGTRAVSTQAPAAPAATATTPIALAKARMLRAVEEKGWEAIRPLMAEDFRWEDRRRLFRMSGDLDLMIASLSERSSSGLKRTANVVCEAGDRVEIRQTLWSGGGDDDKVEIEFLMLTEVDEDGLVRSIVTFDLEDRLEAQREAWARWAAIDPSVAEPLATMMRCMEAFERKDRQTLRQLFVDDVVVVDHRHAAMEQFDDADAYVDSIAVLWDLAPDQRLELGSFLFALEPWGYVASVRRAGEIADGGPFESLYLNAMHTRDGRVCRTEFFEREDLDAALACFESFRPAEGDAPEAGAADSREAARGRA